MTLREKNRLQIAYLTTRYKVEIGRDEFIISPLGDNRELSDFLEHQEVKTGVFVTADNPFSQIQTTRDNADARERLLHYLNCRSIKFVKCRALSADGFPDEEGLLLLDVSATAAARIGLWLGQNAVLACDALGGAEVVWCRRKPSLLGMEKSSEKPVDLAGFIYSLFDKRPRHRRGGSDCASRFVDHVLVEAMKNCEYSRALEDALRAAQQPSEVVIGKYDLNCVTLRSEERELNIFSILHPDEEKEVLKKARLRAARGAASFICGDVQRDQLRRGDQALFPLITLRDITRFIADLDLGENWDSWAPPGLDSWLSSSEVRKKERKAA